MKINIKNNPKIVVVTSALLFSLQSTYVYANPYIPGVFGRAFIEPYFFLPTIIIEFGIIIFFIKTNLKLRLFGGVFLIHLITYPLTIIGGFLFSYFVEIIPLTMEPLLYEKLFARFQRKGLMKEAPSKKRIWTAVVIANLFTFILGLGITSYLRSEGYIGTQSLSQAAKVQIRVLSISLDEFRRNTGRYPTTEEGLNVLFDNPGIKGWSGPYLKKRTILKDPWRVAFYYRSPGEHKAYDLFTYGADKVPGGEGESKDITNW